MLYLKHAYTNFTDLVKRLRKKRNLHILRNDVRKVIFRPVKTVMTRKVVTVYPDASLYEAAKTMVQESLSCLVVQTENEIKGIITERDFVQRVELTQESLSRSVGEVMTDSPFCSTPETTIFEAHGYMISHKFRKLPIVNKDKLVGIVTQTDIIKALERFATHSIIDTLNTIRIWKVMTKDIVKLNQSEPLQEAKQLMAGKNISCILATKDDEVTGIITERDFAAEFAKDVTRLRHYKVQDVMKSPVVSIEPYLQLFEAIHFMLEKSFRRFLVAKEGKPLGIVTQTDIARAVYEFLSTLLKRIESKEIEGLQIEYLER